jgi:transposase InsO family protein
MTSDTQIYKDRLYIIKYYIQNKMSVKKLCKQFNRSRTWFYKWLNRYKLYGDEGLYNITWELPAMPNQTPLDIEMKIITFIEDYPSYGPVRVSNELKKTGITAKPSAVYNMLKRHNLNTRKLRLEHIRIKHNVVKDKSGIERAKELSKTRSLNTKHPGDVVGMDVFYVGCLKGVGRIYQYTSVDTYSSFSWAKLYTDKSTLSACDFMIHVNNNSLNIPIKSVLTDNGKEFTTHHKSKKHCFERIFKELNIKHRLTKVRHPWTNGSVERFQRTVLEEFYQVTFRKKIYITLEELNNDLNKYIDHYNCKRTHQGKRTNGRVPTELYLLFNKSVA